MKPLYNIEELLVTLQPVRMRAPLYDFYMKAGIHFSGLHSQGPSPLCAGEPASVSELPRYLCSKSFNFQNSQAPSLRELKESNDCNTCGQYVVCIMPLHGARLTEPGVEGRRCGTGGAPSTGAGDFPALAVGFPPSSMLLQPESPSTTDGFCSLRPL